MSSMISPVSTTEDQNSPLAINCCPEFCVNPKCPFSPKHISVLRIHIFPNSKEEILTIRSPAAEENNDSGIENNRNSSSHSPSTSLDFSPRSTDFLSPKSHSSSSEHLPPPPPPPSQPPVESLTSTQSIQTRQLDQVLVPVSTTGSSYVRRPSPLEENIDYPPPPHHLQKQISSDKISNSSEEDILTSNRARVSATIPSSSYLREHTKVEPFVAQSIREHQVTTSSSVPETNVDLTVELNREQKAVVTANKFPNREPTAFKRSDSAATANFPSSSINSQYRFASSENNLKAQEPPLTSNRSTTTSYYQYRNNQQAENTTPSSYQANRQMFQQPVPSIRHLSHSISTPNVSNNSSTSMAPPVPPATTTIYRTVDIPFDDSSASLYQPPKRDKDGLIAITIELGAQPVHKGFGFSVSCDRRQCIVDSVIVGTPADKSGLQIGDRIDSINGEKTADQFPSAINRAIHEATRMGEIHLRIEHKDVRTFTTPSSNVNSSNKTNTVSPTSKFNQTRSMFASDKLVESYSEFKRKHSRTPREYPVARDYNSLPRTTSTSTTSYESLPRRRDVIASSYGSGKDQFGGSSRSLNTASSDYKVTALHDKVGPGKLSDFVPEVERSRLEDGPRRRQVDSEEAPRTIRNYQVFSNELGYRNQIQQHQQNSSPSSYKPTEDIQTEEDTHAQTYVKGHSAPEVHLPRVGILKTTSLARQLENEQYLRQQHQRLSHQQEHHYATLEDIRHNLKQPVTRNIPIEILRPGAEVPLTPITHVSEYDIVSDGDEDDDHLFERMHQKQPFHTVGSYGVARNITPRERQPYRSGLVGMASYSSVPELRSRSSDSLDISNVSHRFYDREGNSVQRDQLAVNSIPIHIQRDYGEYMYRREEKTLLETHDWRDIINQQRQPAPGLPVNNHKIKEVTASMSNLPSIIDRKHEESKKLLREQNDYQYQSKDWKQTPIDLHTTKTTETAYSGYNSLGYKPKLTNNIDNTNTNSYTSKTVREDTTRYDDYRSKNVNSQNHTSISTNSPAQKEAQEYIPGGYKEEKQESVVAVSGKHRCAHCSTELGRGAAMIVESLNLYYHLACFKCFVCKAPLGSGATGTDVRVREGHLHCQSCYSNDKLQLSKV